jgi:hypothetical protein
LREFLTKHMKGLLKVPGIACSLNALIGALDCRIKNG